LGKEAAVKYLKVLPRHLLPEIRKSYRKYHIRRLKELKFSVETQMG